ncbi:MAG TPA: YciI family protein [Steroidobacteraceae bacterium]|nr:YciI family protein [Steroidobacteraceae bacterium]
MKQYLLSVCYPASGVQPPPEALRKIMQDVHAVQKEMQDAGAWLFSGGLHPPNTATVVRNAGGEVVTTDGPFIESKEQIGGITILKAADLDAALAWARKLSRATTTPIEVRPFFESH